MWLLFNTNVKQNGEKQTSPTYYECQRLESKKLCQYNHDIIAMPIANICKFHFNTFGSLHMHWNNYKSLFKHQQFSTSLLRYATLSLIRNSNLLLFHNIHRVWIILAYQNNMSNWDIFWYMIIPYLKLISSLSIDMLSTSCAQQDPCYSEHENTTYEFQAWPGKLQWLLNNNFKWYYVSFNT